MNHKVTVVHEGITYIVELKFFFEGDRVIAQVVSVNRSTLFGT